MKFKKLVVLKRSAYLCVDIYIHSTKIDNLQFREQLTQASITAPSSITKAMTNYDLHDKLNGYESAYLALQQAKIQIKIAIEVGFISKKLGTKWLNELRQLLLILQMIINDLHL